MVCFVAMLLVCIERKCNNCIHTLDKTDLAFVNAELKTVTEPGDFDVMIGDKKAVFSYRQ